MTFFAESPDAPFDFAQFKEQQYDRLAELIRQHVDMAQIYASIQV